MSQVHVGPMRSKSAGKIRLTSKDPRRQPLISPNYLSHESDLVEFRAGIRLARELFATSAFDDFRGAELAPGAECESDAVLNAFVRASAVSAYHPSCTLKMGVASDASAVVCPRTMKVHGLEGLRVVDASVMPSIVSGNLNAPVIMIAEKSADIIQEKRPLPSSQAKFWDHRSRKEEAELI